MSAVNIGLLATLANVAATQFGEYSLSLGIFGIGCLLFGIVVKK